MQRLDFSPLGLCCLVISSIFCPATDEELVSLGLPQLQEKRVKGLNFDLGESIALLRESVRGFAQTEIAPIAAQVDRDNQFPRAIWPQAWRAGAARHHHR